MFLEVGALYRSNPLRFLRSLLIIGLTRHYGNLKATTDNGQATQLYSIHDSIAYMVLYARTAHAKASHLIKDQSSTILEGAHAGKALHDASMRGP